MFRPINLLLMMLSEKKGTPTHEKRKEGKRIKMGEQATVTKMSGNKGKVSVSSKPKKNLSQSINSQLAQILNLQQTIGNQAVQRLMESGTICAKFKTGQAKALNLPWIQAAREEEARGEGLTTPPGFVNRIESMHSVGTSLTRKVRTESEALLGGSFGSVRVHIDPAANKITRKLGAKAFSMGNDIYFQKGELDLHGHRGRNILEHELAHVSKNKGQKKIHFWNCTGHKMLTRKVTDPRIFAVELLTKKSCIMDKFRPGENANHGEAGKYNPALAATARMKNMERQWEWLLKATRWARKFKWAKKEYNSGKYNSLQKKIILKRGVRAGINTYNRLGDALHVAQDRGAHWEGIPGKGHDISTLKKGYYAVMKKIAKKDLSCDNPLLPKNQKAFKISEKNSRQVMKAFLDATGFGKE